MLIKKWLSRDVLHCGLTSTKKELRGLSIDLRNLSSSCKPSSKSIYPSGEQSYYNRGTLYEIYVIQSLKKISIDCESCGGPGDGGIDFNGSWILPDASLCSIPVVGQCKRVQSRLRPSSVRELESVVANRSNNTIGMLVSSSGFTEAAVSQYYASNLPLILATIPISETGDSEVTQTDSSLKPDFTEFLWNKPASEIFKNKLTVSRTFGFSRSRFGASNSTDGSGDKQSTQHRLLFLYDGKAFKSLN